MKVLIVDDSKAIIDLLKDILEVGGHLVQTADNGAQALDIYAKFHPDLVILDLALPVIDGFETLKKMVKFDKNAKVLISTASAQLLLLQDCLEMGAIGYITKPFSPKQLMATIATSMKEQYNKRITAFLLHLATELQDTIIKASTIKRDVSVELEKIEMLDNTDDTSNVYNSPSKIDKLVAVPEIVQRNKETFDMLTDPSIIRYITSFQGAHGGEVISFVRASDVDLLLGLEDKNVIRNIASEDLENQAAALFNIINLRIIAELGEAHNMVLTASSTDIYRPDEKGKDDDFARGRNGIKVTYKILIQDRYGVNLIILFRFYSGTLFGGRI